MVGKPNHDGEGALPSNAQPDVSNQLSVSSRRVISRTIPAAPRLRVGAQTLTAERTRSTSLASLGVTTRPST